MVEYAPSLNQDDLILYTSVLRMTLASLSHTREDVQAMDSLQANQEETDTRLALQAVPAADLGAKTAVLCCWTQMSLSFYCTIHQI